MTDVVLVLAVLAVAVLVIIGPLRGSRAPSGESGADDDRDELRAAKEAKLGEIRDAELDYRTGKLSEQDWRALDAALREEAVDLIRRLDSLERPEQLDSPGAS